MNKKDTVRIILFLDCNMNCFYCCNKQEEFKKQFINKKFDEIDFSLYKNVCISGGEPFLRKDILYNILERIPKDKELFIYTNGLLIRLYDIIRLRKYKIGGVNIGIHSKEQFKNIIHLLYSGLPMRFRIPDTLSEDLAWHIPDSKYKIWKMNECDMPNEDWILLNDFKNI